MKHKTLFAFVLLILVSIIIFALKYYTNLEPPTMTTLMEYNDESKNETMVDRQNLLEIDSRIHACKQNIEELTKGNETIIAQVDQFCRHLTETYIAGEGMIENDIYKIIDCVNFAAEIYLLDYHPTKGIIFSFLHPLDTATILLTVGNIRDPDIIMASVLYGSTEKTNISIEELTEFFGARVANFVNEVTYDESIPMTKWQKQLEQLPNKSAGAIQMKLAAMISNLKEILNTSTPIWNQDHINEYVEQVEIFDKILPWVNAGLKQHLENYLMEYKEQN